MADKVIMLPHFSVFDSHLTSLDTLKPSWGIIILGIPAAVLLYGVLLAVYRLCFSPLARFPGPKIAAATAWYEFYYDVVEKGKYYLKIAEMHEKYGPIVRINPWEISVSDGSFYTQVYVSASVRRTQIFPRSRGGIGIDGAHPVSEDHDLHRRRRKPLDPFFSRKQVQSYEPMILDELSLLEGRFQAMKGTGTVVDMNHVFAAIIGDLIGRISVEDPPVFVLDPDFSPDWYDTLIRFFAQILLYTHFTFLMGWIGLIPQNILLSLIPGAAGFKSFMDLVVGHIEYGKKHRHEKEVENEGRKTLIQHLLTSDMPDSEKKTSRLTGEFIAVLAGGTMTTARCLTMITYYALADPRIELRLREELAEIMAGYPEVVPKWSDLEKLPFLAACVKEGLRVSYGSMRRVPRVSPDVNLQYKQWTIPKGTPVGMSAYMMHTDPEVFEEPFRFKPERWLGSYNPHMNRNYVPFSKGSRNCLGWNLAYAEIYLALAVIFRPAGPKMSLYETDEADVVPIHDFFLPVPKLDSKGMRVMVH